MTVSARDQALAQLDDYVRGHMPDEQLDAFEEDLFTRALTNDAPELAFRAQLAETFQAMNARGSLDLWLTARDLDRLFASGVRVRVYEYDTAAPQPPDLSGEFDILVTKFVFDLSGVRRLDAEVCSQSGQPLKQMPDISFDQSDGAVFACCEAELARTAYSMNAITRVWAVDDSGRRLLAELKSV